MRARPDPTRGSGQDRATLAWLSKNLFNSAMTESVIFSTPGGAADDLMTKNGQHNITQY